jgi:2',3'-cyclic-nucleotide 2'-phosphodiesterase (5'-nucleotidase family)
MKFLLRFALLLFLVNASSCSHKPLVTNVSETHYIINKNEIDSATYKTILPYKKNHDELMNKVIASSEEAFIKGDVESTLGNWFCDAVISETNVLLGKDSVMLDVAVFNKGGLRNSLPKGNITVGNIFELMPFDNEVVLLKLSGLQFKDMCDKIAEKGGIPVGGMRMTMNGGTAENITVKGKTFDANKDYWVVTSDYLANGGDNYIFFKNAKERRAMNALLRDVIISYCTRITAKGKTLKPYVDGRIQVSK